MTEPIEHYTPKRRAEFLLSNAVDAEEYAWALAHVRAMGLDPDTIPHHAPPDAFKVTIIPPSSREGG